MRKRTTGAALTLVILASMSLTLGAGMRWAASLKVTTPVIGIVPSISIGLLGSDTSGIDVAIDADAPSTDASDQ